MTAPLLSRSRFSSQLTSVGALLTVSLLVLPLLVSVGAVFADNRDEALTARPVELATDNDYVGVDACRVCHSSQAKGNQYGKWREGPHSKAYETLGTAQAKEIAQEQGISDPQSADACLMCHVTGHDAPPERKGEKYKIEDGVGCESCHGAGSAYKQITIMRDREQAIANGLLIPDGETCLLCHNDKSPTFKGFDYEEMYKKIAHPNPQKP